MLENFTRTEIDTSGARIVTVHGGSGPPLLLLHGNPFTHLTWHKFIDRCHRNSPWWRPTCAATAIHPSRRPAGPLELFVPRDGAGPGRRDGEPRLR